MLEQIIALTSEEVMQATANGGKWLIAAATSSTGLAVIGYLGKQLINYKKSKNAISLTENDQKAIASQVKSEIATGIEIDVSKQIDQATNKRLTEVEEKVNEFADVVNTTNTGVYKIATAVAEFKTISADTRKDLNDFIATEEKKVEDVEVIEKVKATVEKVVEDVKTSLF